MSLAYTLDVSELKTVKNLSSAIINSANQTALGLFAFLGDSRWKNLAGDCQQIYPTGEYIIRGGMFINGMYVYVGSYKAYIRELFGVGSHGYAWDGFIMVMRGYSINQNNGFNILLEDGGEFGPNFENFGFLPMRMPLEVNGGPVGDATAIAADSSVGLHAIDIYKSIEDIQVDVLDDSIRIVTCGFQRIDATVEGVPTGSDYVGNIYITKLLESQGVGGSAVGQYILYSPPTPNEVMQITWKANQAGHADNTNPNGRFTHLRDLDQSIAGNEFITGAAYDYEAMWRGGQLPDGTNPSGGPTDPADRRLITFNYFPRRFLDVTCISQVSITGITTAGSIFNLGGDVAMDTNNDGTIDDTCPVLIGGAFEFPGAWNRMVDGAQPYSYLPPYLLANPAMATSLAVSTPFSTWSREGAAPTYTFSGAVVALITIPYEILPFATTPLIMIAVNNVSHSGTDYGHIYVTQDSPLLLTQTVLPYATEGGAFTTASGISMPNKWYNKAIQERTFSFEEEGRAKDGVYNTLTGEFTPSANSIYDADAKDYIGFRSNYQRYGLTTNPETTGEFATQGTPSRNGYGFLGFKTGVGPIAVMFDSGAPTLDVTASPIDLTGIALAEGANLNDNHIIDPTSTTRRIVNAGWDNDRDQWLFISSDSGGSGVISVAANFSIDSNNIGFLDQTANFATNSLPLPTTANAGLYVPYLMSNALDGFICFGEWDNDTNSRFGIKPILGASSSTSHTCSGVTVNYDYYLGASTSYFYRINGTTGRTTRVWVDYVLFDGADSVIAKKLKEFGIKVNIENVEWFKRKIIRSGDLNIKSEEVEMWMREQQSQYKEMLKEKERMGRIRKKKSQVSAFQEGIEEQINPDFMDDEVKDFLGSFTPETRPPTPEEKRQKKKRQGGYEESTDSYFDDVF